MTQWLIIQMLYLKNYSHAMPFSGRWDLKYVNEQISVTVFFYAQINALHIWLKQVNSE